jgi:hypothetical protein
MSSFRGVTNYVHVSDCEYVELSVFNADFFYHTLLSTRAVGDKQVSDSLILIYG